MTLPANDAFSLSHDSTRPPYSLSLRPTSPKIPFVTSHSRPASTFVSPRKTVRARRSVNNGSADPHHEKHEPPTEPRRAEATSPARAASQADVAKRVDVPPPIDWEIPRKILHSSIGFFTLYLWLAHGSARQVVVVLGAALAVIAPTDILRLNSPGFERIYERFLGFLMRESEKKTTNGVIWYILGVLWVLAVYPLDIAVVSILILSWADTAASTIGRLWGRRTPPLPRYLPILHLPFAARKSLAGFLAGSLTGALIAIGFWGCAGLAGPVEPVWTWEGGVVGAAREGAFGGWLGLGLISAVSGVVSGVAEALDLGSLDDNLTLPIISGGCLWGFFKCLQRFF